VIETIDVLSSLSSLSSPSSLSPFPSSSFDPPGASIVVVDDASNAAHTPCSEAEDWQSCCERKMVDWGSPSCCCGYCGRIQCWNCCVQEEDGMCRSWTLTVVEKLF